MTDPIPTRVKLVLDEVLDGRVEPTREAVHAYVEDFYQGVDGPGRARVTRDVMAEINSWKTQKENKPMSPPKSVLRGKKIIPVAAIYFRADPDLSTEDCYHAMLRDGHRINMQVQSFEGSGYAREARKLASSGEEIDAPPAPETPEPAPAPAEPAEVETEPAEAEPVAEPEPPEVDEEPEPEPVAVTRSTNGAPMDTSDGDYVLLQLGGQKLDAQREGEEWDVAFEGTVGDGMVRELLGRVFGGSS